MAQGHDGTPQENDEIQAIINNMHVSSTEGIAVTLADLSGQPDTVILLFASCCGHTAYSLTLEEAGEAAIGLTRSIQKAKEFSSAIVN